MRYTVLTLFPALLEPLANEGLIKQAREKGLVEIILKQLRDYALDKHRTVDDRPYG
ncbi:MAG: tRNA (guanosine(37)-N1)-methyltransferase TrmD, partial [Deinococcus sp.]|nr:tRNA (guanosine(37)-N1)-methyltransferase TrmD [Deinococcus sp.]